MVSLGLMEPRVLVVSWNIPQICVAVAFYLSRAACSSTLGKLRLQVFVFAKVKIVLTCLMSNISSAWAAAKVESLLHLLAVEIVCLITTNLLCMCSILA